MSDRPTFTVLMSVRCVPHGPGGVERVARELLVEMAVLRPEWNMQTVVGFPHASRGSRLPLIGDLLAAGRIALGSLRRYDVFVVHGAEYAWGVLLVARLKRRPVIVVWHGVRWYEAQGYKARSRAQAVLQRALFALERVLQGLAMYADVTVAVAPKVADEIRTIYRCDEQIHVIPNGVRFDQTVNASSASTTHAPVRSSSPHEQTGQSSRKQVDFLRVLWVGGQRQPFGKGLDVALEACRDARQAGVDLTLEVIGFENPPIGDPELGARAWISWLGKLAPDQMSAAYARSTVLLATTRYEGYGMVVLEALAAGLPVVASPAVAWVIDDAGIALRDWAPSSYAEALALLAHDAPLRQKLQAAAVHRARQFDWTTAAQRYVSLCEQAPAGGIRTALSNGKPRKQTIPYRRPT